VPFIALAPEDHARQRMTQMFDAAGSRPQIVVETPNSATICALAAEGIGIGLVNPAAAEGYLSTELRFRPFEPEVFFTSYLLFRPDAQKGQLVKQFIGNLMDARRGKLDGIHL
jgi:DNA-binding transcriptional LysR family regulator